MYKALITDLDGTVVPIGGSGDDIDNASRAAVAAAVKAGFKIACATGRDLELLGNVMSRLGLVHPCVIDGGARIIDPVNGKTLWEKALQPGAAQAVLKIFKRHTNDALLITSKSNERPAVSEVNNVPSVLRYIYLLNVPPGLAKVISNQVNESRLGAAHMTPSWYGGGHFDIHVTNQEATKEHAIAIWHEMVGVKIDETIGMGDAGNDLPLFQSSGLKVAVGNATNELKKLADYIAPAVDRQPPPHVINKFLLGQT